MYQLGEETPEDFWEVEALYDLCFAPGREALSSYRLRDGVARVAGLSLVARYADGILSGAIRFWWAARPITTASGSPGLRASRCRRRPTPSVCLAMANGRIFAARSENGGKRGREYWQ